MVRISAELILSSFQCSSLKSGLFDSVCCQKFGNRDFLSCVLGLLCPLYRLNWHFSVKKWQKKDLKEVESRLSYPKRLALLWSHDRFIPHFLPSTPRELVHKRGDHELERVYKLTVHKFKQRHIACVYTHSLVCSPLSLL